MSLQVDNMMDLARSFDVLSYAVIETNLVVHDPQ
jgi:hypothetical protein